MGNINIHRDWGWAPEYVEAMWLILQQDLASDYVIATGKSCSLGYFVEQSFSWFDLNWHEHVVFNNELQRPYDIIYSRGNPKKAEKLLGWKTSYDVDDVINEMCIAAANAL